MFHSYVSLPDGNPHYIPYKSPENPLEIPSPSSYRAGLGEVAPLFNSLKDMIAENLPVLSRLDDFVCYYDILSIVDYLIFCILSDVYYLLYFIYYIIVCDLLYMIYYYT